MKTEFGDSLDFNGKQVLITGGTGSFGKRFVKTLLENFNPQRVVIYSRDELKQFDMANELSEHHKKLRFFIGDVRDGERLNIACRGIDYIIHAAAMKHVTIAEYNPFECIQTNVMGAEKVVMAAIQNKVKSVIALSTDKACSPINLYGASKLASDKIFVAAGHLAGGDGPTFAVVRYGNVVGSRGSIVPLFRKLIDDNCTELPITDPEMTRFWISLQQGVDFVCSCLNIMRGGEIFIPIIPSMRITDIVEAMAPGMATKIIGIRPGEKLHEMMFSKDDARSTLQLPDRYIIEPTLAMWTSDRSEIPGAVPVPKNFTYASDTNDQWLSSENLTNMIKDL